MAQEEEQHNLLGGGSSRAENAICIQFEVTGINVRKETIRYFHHLLGVLQTTFTQTDDF